jgi:hypothetical protein
MARGNFAEEDPVNTDPGAHFLEVTLDEYRKLKAQADKALAQTDDRAFFARLDEESNSIALMMKHVSGNLRSRWTDFLTSDGEKPARNRDGEFEELGETRAAIVESWEAAWRQALAALTALGAGDLMRTVAIRGEAHTVVQALVRNLAHTAAHVGQIVLLAKHFAGEEWQTLSIPKRRARPA